MKLFRILDAANVEEYETWIQTWSAWPLREVFAHPEYVKLFTRKNDRAICAVQVLPDGLILLPMILRPLSAELWAGEDNEKYDLVAPYGFGGPYVSGRYDMEAFWRHINHWAAEASVVSAFFRLSPFAADIRGFADVVENSGGNVIRSLTEGKEGIWKDYKNTVRTCVRRAEQSGVTVEFDEAGADIAAFIRLYYQTMQRCHANPQYYFPAEFFHNITARLAGQFFLSHAMYQGDFIASNLILVSQENIYYYLAASNENFFHLNPNQFLTTMAFHWGIEHGKKACILGGGYDGYDGVFQYKKAFSPSGVVPFQIGKHIFDNREYGNLCAKRMSYELECGQAWDDCGTYFPAYRSKND